MKWNFIVDSELSIDDKKRIAKLKDQHWPNGIESQMSWMKENINQDDIHLIGEDDSCNESVVLAYVTLTRIVVTIDGIDNGCVGLGGVCVDKKMQHMGIGKQAVTTSDDYIKKTGNVGVLLCKKSLVGFYRECGWNVISFQSASVANKNYEHVIMVNEKPFMCKKIVIDRNF